jgi:predicted transport protein
MSDIKLFTLDGNGAKELSGSAAKLERDLQTHVEDNMEVLLGVRFLKTEHSTGNTHKGRIDSLGLDENNCPVIIEYKRDQSSTVINQGLFYLDWLQKNQGDFKWLVMEKLGKDIADEIEWNGARLVCMASDFPKYDLYAIEQINANIELIRYRYFGSELLLLELVNSQTANGSTVKVSAPKQPLVSAANTSEVSLSEARDTRKDYHEDRKQQASPEHLALYEAVCDFALSLGDEVQRKELKFYTALKLIRNFLSVQVWAPVRDPAIRLYLHLDPDTVALEEGFSADMRNKGHWGTGDLEVVVRNLDDLEKAKSLIKRSYEQG